MPIFLFFGKDFYSEDFMKSKILRFDSISTLREENLILKRRIEAFEEMTKNLANALDRQRRIIETFQKNKLTRKAA